MKILNERKIELVKNTDNGYPFFLRKIQEPPPVLHCIGKLLSQEQCFGIVGTRRASAYGKEIAFSFAKELGRAGLTIVSGMARGIDEFAHKGALEAGARTIAVLGTGLDEKTIYPQENLQLAEQILKSNGTLISEYPEKTHGSRFTFLHRNRIISGMSLGVLVVEAKYRSGALNTANWAKKQNKKVFAIPGSVYSQNSNGCHLLIKQGAKLVETPQDIIKELGIKNLPSFTQNTKSKNPLENKILEILQKGNQQIDQIIKETKLPAQTILPIISLMELEQKIKNLGGNTYALNI